MSKKVSCLNCGGREFWGIEKLYQNFIADEDEAKIIRTNGEEAMGIEEYYCKKCNEELDTADIDIEF